MSTNSSLPKRLSAAITATLVGLASLHASAAMFDENTYSFLPMTAAMKTKMASMMKDKSKPMCASTARWGDENDLSWMVRVVPCEAGDKTAINVSSMKMMEMKGSTHSTVRWGDENDLSWLYMTPAVKEMMAKMVKNSKGMCISTLRIGDENDLRWMMRANVC